MTTFQPLADYTGYNHVLSSAPTFIHPGNGNVYACACEQLANARQNLTVYRLKPGVTAWEPVRSYKGTIDAEGHITMGGAVILPSGHMLVLTSLAIKGAEKVTGTGFQGVWRLEEPEIMDAPYTTLEALEARIRALEWFFAIPGTLRLPAQEAPARGGEIMLADGKGGNWSIDVTNGELRIFLNGVGGKVALKLTG